MRGRGTLVLCFHAIGDAWSDPLSLPLARFERQLRLVQKRRRAGTLADAVADAPGRYVVTFDDAFVSIQSALTALERVGAKAAIFACSGYGDGRPLTIPEFEGDRGGPPDERQTMAWPELREWAERGHEIGSHTVTHPHLTQLDDRQLRLELTESRNEIEDEIGRPCRYLAYPYGEHDGRVRAAAREAGYSAAFALPGRLSPRDPYALPRVGFYRDGSPPRDALKLSLTARQAFEAIRRLRDPR